MASQLQGARSAQSGRIAPGSTPRQVGVVLAVGGDIVTTPSNIKASCGATRLLSCPSASPRAASAWYPLDDRPMPFAVTSLLGDEGSGLFAVLDYRDWAPGAAMIARAALDRPASCGLPPMDASSLRQQEAAAPRQC
jgi:hypothetical protein